MQQILVRSDNKRMPKPKTAFDEELERRVKEMQAYKGEKIELWFCLLIIRLHLSLNISHLRLPHLRKWLRRLHLWGLRLIRSGWRRAVRYL